DNNLKDQVGYFKIFNHSTKTIVDSIEIYNVATAPEPEPENPETGDNSFMAVLSMIIAAFVLFAVFMRLKNVSERC
ncbi:MAG TPA: hypothetical protein PKM70_06545, partial [Clostridia bacterium]|nr:hypothetical protein [Clostridia bacterium]